VAAGCLVFFLLDAAAVPFPDFSTVFFFWLLTEALLSVKIKQQAT